MRSLTLVLFAAAACGGGKENPPFTPDAFKAPDAAPVTCLMAPSMGTVMPAAQEAHAAMGEEETSPSNFYYYGDLNADAAPDVLLIDLYEGYGAFASGWPTQPVTIQLVGEEIDYSTCGACILGLTDYTADGPTGDPYMATSGTLTLMTTGPTTLKGTLTNVKLSHVTIDEDTAATAAHEDGCTSELASLDFEAAIDPMMARSKTRLRVPLTGRSPR